MFGHCKMRQVQLVAHSMLLALLGGVAMPTTADASDVIPFVVAVSRKTPKALLVVRIFSSRCGLVLRAHAGNGGAGAPHITARSRCRRRDQRDGQHDLSITILHRLHAEPAHSGNAEDRLDNN